MVMTPAQADTDTKGPDARSDSDAGCVVLLGTSPAVNQASVQVQQAASGRLPVLLLAEVGLDAPALAREIHRRGVRSNEPFLTVDCAGSTPDDLERQLFGAGGGEGATDHLETLGPESPFLRAGSGTVFLANVVDLSAGAQRRLASVLRDGEAVVGPSESRQRLQVRVIAASGPDLGVELHEGRFRADLHRRLSGVVIEVPPLRSRAEDLPGIADAVARHAAHAADCAFGGFTQTALTLLGACPWRGNLDELRGLLERVVTASSGGLIRIEDLLAHVRLDGQPPPVTPDGTLREAKRRFERDYILATLEHHEGRMADAAKALGIQRTNLYRKIRQLGVKRRTKRDTDR